MKHVNHRQIKKWMLQQKRVVHECSEWVFLKETENAPGQTFNTLDQNQFPLSQLISHNTPHPYPFYSLPNLKTCRDECDTLTQNSTLKHAGFACFQPSVGSKKGQTQLSGCKWTTGVRVCAFWPQSFDSNNLAFFFCKTSLQQWYSLH